MGHEPQAPRGTLSAGTKIGRYELLRRLARGGMAELYLARDGGDGQLCVLKLVLPHLAEDRQFVDMFLREARIAAGLEHPNIAHVTDTGEHDGEPFFVMPYIHGRDLRTIVDKLGETPLPLSAALTITRDLASGLHYVHERTDDDGKPLGLVHRDVSPSNVMIAYDGDVRLVDFGIAKSTEQRSSTRTGVLKGKVSYMSPEQCHGHKIDRRTDVFNLGILLYEMTTGQRLFAGDNDFYVMTRIVRGMYARPREVSTDYPEALEAILERALQVDPDDRYPTTEALQADLEAFAAERGTRLSNLSVAKFMRKTWGEQPGPEAGDPLEASPTEIRFPDDPSPVRVRRASSSRRGNPSTTRIGSIERDEPEHTHVGSGAARATRDETRIGSDETRIGPKDAPASRRSASQDTRVGPKDDDGPRRRVAATRIGAVPRVGTHGRDGSGARSRSRSRPRGGRSDHGKPSVVVAAASAASVHDLGLDVDTLAADFQEEDPTETSVVELESEAIEELDDETRIALRESDVVSEDDPTESLEDDEDPTIALDGATVARVLEGGEDLTELMPSTVAPPRTDPTEPLRKPVSETPSGRHYPVAPVPPGAATRMPPRPLAIASQPYPIAPGPIAAPHTMMTGSNSGVVVRPGHGAAMRWLVVAIVALALGTITAAWLSADDEDTPEARNDGKAAPPAPEPAPEPEPEIEIDHDPDPGPSAPVDEVDTVVIEPESNDDGPATTLAPPVPAPPAAVPDAPATTTNRKKRSKRRRGKKKKTAKQTLDGMYPSG